jgi:hypothetical protein
MKTHKPIANFSLTVESMNLCEVWPIDTKAKSPRIDDQIAESYYYDDDIGASCAFDIVTMDELMEIMAFYAGKAVKITLGCEVITSDINTEAYLDIRGSSASFTAKDEKQMSNEMAAQKLRAIANAITA